MERLRNTNRNSSLETKVRYNLSDFFIINPNSHSFFNGSVALVFADLIKRNSIEAKEKDATSKNVKIVQICL